MNSRRALMAAALTGVQVGAALVATRFVIAQTTPASLAFMRYLIGFCVLLVPVLLSKPVRLERRDLVPIALLGIGQFGILLWLMNYAVQFIPSARAALIFATTPLLTMILAATLRLERFTTFKTLGVILTIAGVGLAVGEKAFQGASSQEWLGELAVLGSAFIGAVCSVLYRPYLRKYPTLPVSALAMFASVLFLALVASLEGFFRAVPVLTPPGWAAVAFIGVSSGVGYFLWLWALHNTTPTRVTVFLSLSPVTATILGGLLLREPVSVFSVLGVALVGLGLWVTNR